MKISSDNSLSSILELRQQQLDRLSAVDEKDSQQPRIVESHSVDHDMACPMVQGDPADALLMLDVWADHEASNRLLTTAAQLPLVASSTEFAEAADGYARYVYSASMSVDLPSDRK